MLMPSQGQEPFTPPTPFTLNVRLTARCNADCVYCSSDPHRNAGRYLRPGEYLRILQFLWRAWADLGIRPTHVVLQYIGGEILTIPEPALRALIAVGRRFFHMNGVWVNDGAQSNLIGSRHSVGVLREIFGDRIGTSVDHYTTRRTLRGSVNRYRVVLMRRLDELAGDGFHPGAVLVVDAANVERVTDELVHAEAVGYGLTLRPVYPGARTVTPAPVEKLHSVYVDTFNQWFLNGRVIVQPFYGMLRRRINHWGRTTDALHHVPGCHFQYDCAQRQVHIEPDGELYLCMDLADMGRGRIGNGLTAEFDLATWERLARRSADVHPQCHTCAYFQDCQGGCMAESAAAGLGLERKTYLCRVWISLFSRIDKAIEELGLERVREWALSLETVTAARRLHAVV